MTARGLLPSKPENFKISFPKSTLQTPCFFTKVFYFFLHQYGPREVQKAKNHIQKRLPSWSKSRFYDFAENPIFGQTSQLLPNFFMACYWTYIGVSLMIKRIGCCHLCGNRPILEIPLKNGVDFGHTPDLPNEAAQRATKHIMMNLTKRKLDDGILVTILNTSWWHLVGQPDGPSVKMISRLVGTKYGPTNGICRYIWT